MLPIDGSLLNQLLTTRRNCNFGPGRLLPLGEDAMLDT